MRKTLLYLGLCIFTGVILPIRFAFADIVYAARYYNPPGSKKVGSYMHIYRIRPDGSHRRQLTYGNFTDEEPKWSPDGKHIAFWRVIGEPDVLCVMSVQNRKVHRIGGTSRYYDFKWLDNHHIAAYDINNKCQSYDIDTGKCITYKYIADTISPDGKYRYHPEDGKGIIIRPNGKSNVLDLNYSRDPEYVPYCSVWLNNNLLVCYIPSNDIGMQFYVIGIGGKVVSKHFFYFDNKKQPVTEDCIQKFDAFKPDGRNYFIGIESLHNSTVGINNAFYKVDVKTGKSVLFAKGQFLVWSPDAKQYCIAPGRDLINYSKKKNGDWRTVWSAPLSVVNVKTGKAHQITPDLCWVKGYDWR